MEKHGMSRPDRTHTKPRNTFPPIPQIQGKTSNGNVAAPPIISGTQGPDQKVFRTEKPISDAYSTIDSDLARDNMENDLPDADLQDL